MVGYIFIASCEHHIIRVKGILVQHPSNNISIITSLNRCGSMVPANQTVELPANTTAILQAIIPGHKNISFQLVDLQWIYNIRGYYVREKNCRKFRLLKLNSLLVSLFIHQKVRGQGKGGGWPKTGATQYHAQLGLI